MVRRSGGRIATLLAVGALALTASACGSDSSDDGGGGKKAAEKKVGVILPDATTSPRWEANDRPSLEKAFSDAGIKSDIQNAGKDKATFGTICDGMINSGVQVLSIVNLDSDSGSACLKKATQAGIATIDYDRLTLGGGASYYVSFDNAKVGGLLGDGLTKCLDDQGKSKANIVYINGDPTDNNAALFKSGYAAALKPKIDSGDYTLVGDTSGFWDKTKAQNAFEQLYTQNKGKIDGVVAANDTMAGGVIAALSRNKLDGKVPVTGQDATDEGLQAVLKGTQCMTAYKNTALEAKGLSDIAIALINGDKDKADSLATKTEKDTVTGKDVPSLLIEPQPIYQDSVKVPIADGYAKKANVCKGEYAALCTKYGVQ